MPRVLWFRRFSPTARQRAWRTRFVVDASGRDTLLTSKFKSEQKNPDHNSTALFGHFRDARRLEGKREGSISICWFEHGWFWFIPLADGTTSVGAVCWAYYLKARDKPLKEYFFDNLAMCPELNDRLRNATLVDDAVHAPAARRALERLMRAGPRDYSWFIYRVTNPTIRDMFMHPKNTFKVKQGLMSLLAADLRHGPGYRVSLVMFKAVYYFVSVLNWRRTYARWQRHRSNVRDMGPLKGETVLKAD